jgi:p-aminobenzoyl-glutamate transporter AbgT
LLALAPYLKTMWFRVADRVTARLVPMSPY